MPRRRANNQEPPRKRSRNGCDKCRTRKVRCDEAKPACGQCRAKGHPCETTVVLKWEADYQNVGRAFGRTGVWSKNAIAKASPSSPCFNIAEEEVPWCEIPHISSYSFVNSTVGKIEELTTLEHRSDGRPPTTDVILRARTPERDDTASTASLSPWLSRRRLSGNFDVTSIPAALSPMPRLQNQMHSHLLSYYVERLCPLTIPSTACKSPFASLILPFSISSAPVVLESLLALAACHRSKSDISFKPTALQLGDKVLRTLRARLIHEDAHKVAMDPETLVLMMILCQFEIINECDKRWVVHLKGARDLIRVRRQALAEHGYRSQSNELVVFTEKYFAYQDVIGRTACGEEPIFGSDFWTAREDETDAWLGCSSELVATICDITELSRQHRIDPSVSMLPEFQIRAASLERRLTGLEQRVFGEEDDLLQTSAELKRIAAEVYLHCSIYGASPSILLIREHVQQIVRLVYVLLEQGVTAGLTWPVFVAAVELDPIDDFEWTADDERADGIPHHARPFILYALEKMSVSIVNISRTRSVIEKVWHIREFDDSPDARKLESESGFNDWERFVAPFCGNMSLA